MIASIVQSKPQGQAQMTGDEKRIMWSLCNLRHRVISIFEWQDILQAIILRVSLLVTSYDNIDMQSL